MKKTFFIILLATLFNTVAEAQMKFGVRAATGVILARSESTFTSNGYNDFVSYQVKFEEATPVLSTGIYVQEKIGFLFFQTEVLYSAYKAKYDVTSYFAQDVPSGIYTDEFHYVDVQVLAGLNGHGFRLGIGPVLHFLADHDTDLNAIPIYNERLRKLSYGFTGGIGYDIGLFSIDFKYEKAFRTVGDHIYYGVRKSKFKGTPDQLSLSVGFGF